MADISSQIQQARQAGYSDQDIASYLSQNHPELGPKIGQAMNSGYQPTQIVNFLAGSSPNANAQPASQPAQDNRSVLDKAASYVPFGKMAQGAVQAAVTPTATNVAENISSLNHDTIHKLVVRIGNETDPTKKANLQKILNKFITDTGDQPSAEDMATNGQGYVSPRQVAGSAISGAATLATLGLPTEAASTGQLADAAATTVAQRIGLGTAAGLGFGAGDATANANSAGEAAKDVATGGIAGGATAGALEGAAALAHKVVGAGSDVLQHTAESIYNKLIKTPIAQSVAGKENIGTGLLKRGVTGSLDDIANELQSTLHNNGQKIGQITQDNASVPVSLDNVFSKLSAFQQKLADTPGESASAQRVQSVIDDIKAKTDNGTMSFADAQKLKQNLQSAVGPAFLKDRIGEVTTQAQKIAANELRNSLENAVPEIAPLNREYEFGLRALKQVIRSQAVAPSKIQNLLETVGLMGGIATHNPAVTGTVAAEKLGNNPAVGTRVAQLLQKTASAAKSANSVKIPHGVVALLQRLTGNAASQQ